jgi:hypothetical protein
MTDQPPGQPGDSGEFNLRTVPKFENQVCYTILSVFHDSKRFDNTD